MITGVSFTLPLVLAFYFIFYHGFGFFIILGDASIATVSSFLFLPSFFTNVGVFCSAKKTNGVPH